MWIKSFLDYLAGERNYSAATIASYQDDLKAFQVFYEKTDAQLDWASIEGDVVRNWMASMMDAGNKATSVNRRLSALRCFYRYCMRREWVKKDPTLGIKGPKKAKSLPAFVREEEMNRLLDGFYFQNDFQGRRDKLIIEVFYLTGVRLSELVGLNVQSVDFSADVIKVTGKRNKQRFIPFGEELKAHLQSYLQERFMIIGEEGGAFFIDMKGERVKDEAVRLMVKRYLSMVTTQLKKSPHVLRHTFATSMLNNHADLESLRELMGHDSVATTEIYTHVTFEELKKMYNLAHPRA